MSITLDWLLHQSPLENLVLLTCPHLINSTVSSVNIMDNPDVLKWTKKDELIFTSGYVFLEKPELQETILREIKTSGCAALCFKTKRYFDSVPKEILELAEEIDLPIIESPFYYTFSDMAKAINNQLQMAEFEEVAKEQTLYNTLFHLVFEQRPFSEALEVLSNHLELSLFVIDGNRKCCWQYVQPKDAGVFGSFSEEHSYVHFQLSPKEYPQQVLSIGIWKDMGCIFPMQDNQYFLCIPMTTIDFLPEHLISHAIKIISFTSSDVIAKQPNINGYYDSFFHYLMNGRAQNELETLQLCKYYGFPLQESRICLLLSPVQKDYTLDSNAIIEKIKSILKDAPFPATSHFVAYGKHMICLYLFGDSDILPAFARYFAEQFHTLTQGVFLVGSSSCSGDLNHLPAAYQEATFMASLLDLFPDQRTFLYPDYLLFWQIQNMPALERQKFVEDSIGPLLAYDREHHASLTETLDAYCTAMFNGSSAATTLYIHRNTFVKRMEKIKQLLHFEEETIFLFSSLYFALSIHRFDKSKR